MIDYFYELIDNYYGSLIINGFHGCPGVGTAENKL
jgi:hypothetical protein